MDDVGRTGAAVPLAAIAASVFDDAPANLVSLWDHAASLARREDTRSAALVLALAGTFLCYPLRLASAYVSGVLHTDVRAVRSNGALDSEACAADHEDAVATMALEEVVVSHWQKRVDSALQRSAPWLTVAGAAAAAERCTRSWLAVVGDPEAKALSSEARIALGETAGEGNEDDVSQMVSLALGECLPDAVVHLRTEAKRLNRSSLAEPASQERRALALALSFHWIFERAHYTVVRDRFGLCLPPLLQVLDGCTEPVVRLVGLSALSLLLDRAMATEVQNFVPPLEHCFTTSSPLFFDGDTVVADAVAPYCTGYVLLLLKAYSRGGALQRSAFDRFLSFGGVHCRAKPVAFRLFMESGLLPLLRRDALLLAPRLRQVMEILLQSTEAVDAGEVILAWRCLCLLLSGNLRPRVRRYAMDILLRATFTYLTFIVSEAPPFVRASGVDSYASASHCNRSSSSCIGGGFVSPVIQAMTSAEWSVAERLRPALTRVVRRGLALLGAADWCSLDVLLSDLGDHLAEKDTERHCALVTSELERFVAFARGAATQSTVNAKPACT